MTKVLIERSTQRRGGAGTRRRKEDEAPTSGSKTLWVGVSNDGQRVATFFEGAAGDADAVGGF